MNYTKLEDTIVNVATPVGRSALAIVRISGRDTFNIISKICFSTHNNKPLTDVKQNGLYYINLKKGSDGSLIDEIMLTTMKSPHSFTGEDIAEIMCHGSPIIVDNIISTVISFGARAALRGEFTYRAYINSKVDLSQAESIHDIIMSSNTLEVKQGLSKLKGGLKSELVNARNYIKDAIIMIEADIDFPEDDTGEFTFFEFGEKLNIAKSELKSVSDKSAVIKNYIKGIDVAICGRVNSGKSSLFNAILGQERAIVTDISGTTRDVIDESFYIKNIPFNIKDTAGFNEISTDIVENIGIDKTKDTINNASIIMFVIDSSIDITNEDTLLLNLISDKKKICVINKTDKQSKLDISQINKYFADNNIIKASTITGEGISILKDTLFQIATDGDTDVLDEAVYVNERESSIIEKSISLIDECIKLSSEKVSTDILSFKVDEVNKTLSEIFGDITSEEIISSIFSSFCIGK